MGGRDLEEDSVGALTGALEHHCQGIKSSTLHPQGLVPHALGHGLRQLHMTDHLIDHVTPPLALVTRSSALVIAVGCCLAALESECKRLVE